MPGIAPPVDIAKARRAFNRMAVVAETELAKAKAEAEKLHAASIKPHADEYEKAIAQFKREFEAKCKDADAELHAAIKDAEKTFHDAIKTAHTESGYGA